VARKPDLEKRARLVQEAFDVICERGVHNTTMKDLAAELGMGRSTLYWYFSDLGDVFEHILERTYDDLQTWVAARVEGVSHPIDFLDALIEAVVEFQAERRDAIVVMFQLWGVGRSSDPESVLARGAAFGSMLRSMLVDTLERGIDDGQVEDCDAEGIVELALTIVDGALVQQLTRNPRAGLMLKTFREQVLAPLRRP